MDKKKNWFLLLLLLLFISGLGLLSVSRELPFSHDPIEDDSDTYRIVEEQAVKENDADKKEDADKTVEDVKKRRKQRAPQNVEKVNHGTSVCKADCEEGTKNRQELSFSVMDEEGVIWKSVDPVNIFANEEFEGKAVIAPESTGVYRFFIANEESSAVKYHIAAREVNEMKIPMMYRLKCNGVYVTDWQASQNLSFNMEKLKSGKRDILELEWKWKSSSRDTDIGMRSDQIQYHVYLRLQAEEAAS